MPLSNTPDSGTSPPSFRIVKNQPAGTCLRQSLQSVVAVNYRLISAASCRQQPGAGANPRGHRRRKAPSQRQWRQEDKPPDHEPDCVLFATAAAIGTGVVASTATAPAGAAIGTGVVAGAVIAPATCAYWQACAICAAP